MNEKQLEMIERDLIAWKYLRKKKITLSGIGYLSCDWTEPLLLVYVPRLIEEIRELKQEIEDLQNGR